MDTEEQESTNQRTMEEVESDAQGVLQLLRS